MTVVVDTSILIDHLRGDARAHRLLNGAFAGGERVTASVMSKVEVLAGMHHTEEAATRLFLSILEWVPVDDGLADAAGEIARQHLRSHPGVDPVDFVIAATVDLLGATLWTRNRKHFPMFRDLPALYD